VAGCFRPVINAMSVSDKDWPIYAGSPSVENEILYFEKAKLRKWENFKKYSEKYG
jgi:hypothetical protein